MAHKFKVGDRVKIITSLYGTNGEEGRIRRVEGESGYMVETGTYKGQDHYSSDEGSCYYYSGNKLELLSSITFDQMMEAFKKHLPNSNEHVTLLDGFKAYRSGYSYLSLDFGKSIMFNLHDHNREEIKLEPETQYLCNIALEKLKEYEAEQEPVEMTIGEIADKLGIDSSKLKIKE